MLLEFAKVTHIPNVVANSIVFGIRPSKVFAGDFLADFDRFQHGTMAKPPTTDIVNFAATGIAIEVVKRRNQIEAMNVVANLFALVANTV